MALFSRTILSPPSNAGESSPSIQWRAAAWSSPLRGGPLRSHSRRKLIGPPRIVMRLVRSEQNSLESRVLRCRARRGMPARPESPNKERTTYSQSSPSSGKKRSADERHCRQACIRRMCRTKFHRAPRQVPAASATLALRNHNE